MKGNDFYPASFTITRFPFSRPNEAPDGKNGDMVVLFYVHHAQIIDRVNERLEKMGHMAMNAADLEIFFRAQKGLLESLEFEYIVATGDIEKVDEQTSIMTCITDGEKKEKMLRRVRFSTFLHDHSGIYVAAILTEQRRKLEDLYSFVVFKSQTIELLKKRFSLDFRIGERQISFVAGDLNGEAAVDHTDSIGSAEMHLLNMEMENVGLDAVSGFHSGPDGSSITICYKKDMVSL